MPRVNSSNWCKHIVLVAGEIDKNIKETYPEYLDFYSFDSTAIHNSFELYANKIINEIKNDMDIKNESLVDRHKIISGYIKAFLHYPVFNFDSDRCIYEKQKPPLIFYILNEYFYLKFVKIILSSDWNNNRISFEVRVPDNISNTVSDKQDDLLIGRQYEDHFYQLINYYKTRLDKYPIFAISHLVFYIEMSSACIFNSMTRHYFKKLHKN